jgi:hypothetical protein
MLGTVAGNCNKNGNAHTRTGSCAIFEGTPNALILTNKSALFSPDEAAFNTEIKEGIYAPSKGRVIPVTGIVSLTANGGDLRTSQEGFGGEKPNGLNPLREDYTITEGGFCLYKQLSKLNGIQVRMFKVDDQLRAFGTSTINEGEEKTRGYLVTVGVSRRISTGSDQTGAIILSLLYSANFQNEDINANAVQLDELPEGLSGIRLKKTGSGKAKVFTACDAEDITDDYGVNLAEPALYKNRAGGNPTAVAYASGELTFTPAAAYKIVDAAALKAEGIEGYEGEEDYVDIS